MEILQNHYLEKENRRQKSPEYRMYLSIYRYFGIILPFDVIETIS